MLLLLLVFAFVMYSAVWYVRSYEFYDGGLPAYITQDIDYDDVSDYMLTILIVSLIGMIGLLLCPLIGFIYLVVEPFYSLYPHFRKFHSMMKNARLSEVKEPKEVESEVKSVKKGK